MNKKRKNIKAKKILTQITLMVFLSLYLVSCSEDVTPSLWEEKPPGTTPVVNSIEPQEALAGVTKVTITGENFSDDSEKNIVFFDAGIGTILENSPTKLVVRVPDVVGDSVEVKVGVQGVELFNDPYYYKMIPAVIEYYDFKDFEQPYAITTDKNENIYFSFVSDNVGQGIKKLSPDGVITDFAPKGSETFYDGLKYGPDDALYGVRKRRAVFRITEGENPAVFKVLDNGVALFDLDFDENQNIWTGGTGGKIFSITPENEAKSFEFEPELISLRVFDNYLYVAGKNDDEKAVWRFKINSADDLGPAEKYFDYSANYPAKSFSIGAITFSDEGVMYIGTNIVTADDIDDIGNKAIIRVDTDGSHSEWYPELISGPVINFAWGNAAHLYYTRDEVTGDNSSSVKQTIIRVDMEQNGAPYFGRD